MLASNSRGGSGGRHAGPDMQRAADRVQCNQDAPAPELPLRILMNSLRGDGNHGTRAVDAGDAGLIEEFVVLRRNDAADDHKDVIAAEFAQLVDQLRDQGFVAGGERGDADGVDIVFRRVQRRLRAGFGRAGRCRHRSRYRRRPWR